MHHWVKSDITTAKCFKDHPLPIAWIHLTRPSGYLSHAKHSGCFQCGIPDSWGILETYCAQLFTTKKRKCCWPWQLTATCCTLNPAKTPRVEIPKWRTLGQLLNWHYNQKQRNIKTSATAPQPTGDIYSNDSKGPKALLYFIYAMFWREGF